MSGRDTRAEGLPSQAVQGGLCAVLALLFLLGGDRLAGLERGFYDLAQRLAAAGSDAPVVIVSPDGPAGDLWTLPRLAELIQAARAAGATAIVPAAAAPPPAASDEFSRLQSLLRLAEAGGASASGTEPGELRRQLAVAEGRVTQQQRVAAAISAAGNVVLGLATTDPGAGLPATNSTCARRIADASERYAGAYDGPPAMASLAPATAMLCDAAAAVGHVALLTDRDGVVRRGTPVLTTEPGAVPSTALAALWLGAAAPGHTGNLARFYQAPDGGPGFTVISAADLLDGTSTEALRDRYVVIGQAETEGARGVRTPLAGSLSPAVMIATDLANYLEGRHITRPAWATPLEILLALLAAGVALVAGRLSLPVGALVALSGTALFLLAEYLLVTRAGLWLHLTGLALFCLTGVALLQLVTQLGRRPGLIQDRTGVRPIREAGPAEELDLGFSVLRQQPTTERTKAQLYELAMEHGKRRDYARAERVFRHLAARDPGYRDVAAKLEKLSGARGAPVPKPTPVRVETAPVTAAAASSAPVPRTLGRYELERVIGRGAMATVYLGRDPTINRRVAIKTLPLAEEFADNDLATARSHFLREAESAGRLNHPNIISIHDAGEDNQVAYLAMEYFEGKPLSHYAQVGRLLPPKVVFELMARAAEALHYAHSQNVVHRDVKPANLMYDVASDRLKLTDFGIARLTDTSRTRTGIILGTPSYMSPEQLSASHVDGQSDLYSLGVTMYHLLTGSPPFQADSIPRLMDKIVHHRHRPVADLRDDVPPCVDGILDRALAKDPGDRYESGKAMAMALRECCSRFPPDSL